MLDLYEEIKISFATLVGADGIFHLISSLDTLMKYAPDWVIAGFFDSTGYSLGSHRTIGMFLLIGTLVFFSSSDDKFKDRYTLFMAVPTLVLISVAVILRFVGLA